MGLKHRELSWLIEHTDALDGDEDVKNFVLLIAQDHPELFEETITRVEDGDYTVRPLEIALTESNVPVPVASAKTTRNHGAYYALLSDAEYAELKAIRGSQRSLAMRRLQELDDGFASRYSNDSDAAYWWVGELPNIKAYGC